MKVTHANIVETNTTSNATHTGEFWNRFAYCLLVIFQPKDSLFESSKNLIGVANLDLRSGVQCSL